MEACADCGERVDIVSDHAPDCTRPKRPRTLVDTQAAAAAVRRPAGTVRRWASVGRLKRYGQDEAGRTVYDLADVYRVAKSVQRNTPKG